MQKVILFYLLSAVFYVDSMAQLHIQENALLYLQRNAKLYVSGDLYSESSIEGPGIIQMVGIDKPHININNFTVPNFVLDVNTIAELDGNLNIGSSLLLQSGLLRTNNHDVILHDNATILGSNNSYVYTTNGTVKKAVSGDISSFVIPVGTANSFLPVELTTKGRYHNAFIAVSTHQQVSGNKPANVMDYLSHSWTITQQGINGDVQATGHLNNTSGSVHGNVRQLRSYYWNGMNWQLQATGQLNNNRVSAKISSAVGELYAMSGTASTQMELLNNPAKKFTVLQVTTSQSARYRIGLIDATGKVVKRMDWTTSIGVNQKTIALDGLSNGAYFIQVLNKEENQTLKGIKIE